MIKRLDSLLKAVLHLAAVECTLLKLAKGSKVSVEEGLLKDTVVPSLRREMANLCQERHLVNWKRA